MESRWTPAFREDTTQFAVPQRFFYQLQARSITKLIYHSRRSAGFQGPRSSAICPRSQYMSSSSYNYPYFIRLIVVFIKYELWIASMSSRVEEVYVAVIGIYPNRPFDSSRRLTEIYNRRWRCGLMFSRAASILGQATFHAPVTPLLHRHY